MKVLIFYVLLIDKIVKDNDQALVYRYDVTSCKC